MTVFRNIGPGVGIEILGLPLLKFSFWSVEAVLSRGCCQGPFPRNMKEGSLISRVSLIFIVFLFLLLWAVFVLFLILNDGKLGYLFC